MIACVLCGQLVPLAMAMLCEPRRSVRRAVVAELWLQGVSYGHIARALGYSIGRRDIAAACMPSSLIISPPSINGWRAASPCEGFCNNAPGSSMLAWMTAASTRAQRPTSSRRRKNEMRNSRTHRCPTASMRRL
jgi:hypothetical protein